MSEYREQNFSLVEQARLSSKVAMTVCDNLDNQLDDYFGLTKEVVNNIDRVDLTGCGDTYMVSLSALEAYKKIAGLDGKAHRTIDFSRFENIEYLKNSLVIGSTISGGVVRTRECILLAKKYGLNTMAITNSLNSPTAQIVDYIVHIGLPAGLASGYGLHSYSDAVISHIYVAVAIGILKDIITEEKGKEIIKDLKDYIFTYNNVIDEIDNIQKETALSWSKLDAYEFIADNSDYSASYFNCANVFEEFGATAFGTDTLNWQFESTNYEYGDKIGRIFTVNDEQINKDIQLKNINMSVLKGYPTFVITDIDERIFPNDTIVVKLSKAKYSFFNSALQHIGFDMVVGYIRKNKNVISFCAEDPIFKNKIVKGRLKDTVMLI